MSNSLKFPKKFLWGAGTSAHQVEGGLHNQWTVWELENARSLAARAPYRFGELDNWSSIAREAKNPNNYVSGRAVDHYRRYEEDFDLLERMGLNSFRCSIEWSRIEPKQGAWDAGEIEHYRTYLRALKKRGITPVVTLFHSTLPVWFAELGGFEKRRNVKYFAQFAEKIFEELGRELEYVITINEPTVYALQSYEEGNWPPNQMSGRAAFRVLEHLIVAHKKVYALARNSEHARRLKVSMAHRVNYFYPGDDARVTRLTTWGKDFQENGWVLRRVRKQSDFLAVNYSQAFRMYGTRAHNSELLEQNDLGWDMQPELLEDLLKDLWEQHRLPIMIAENGVADAEDSRRIDWLKASISAMHRALESGVRVIGYQHASLLDSFEWDRGYWVKFGLVAVNRRTMERTLRDSGKWYGQVVRRLSK